MKKRIIVLVVLVAAILSLNLLAVSASSGFIQKTAPIPSLGRTMIYSLRVADRGPAGTATAKSTFQEGGFPGVTLSIDMAILAPSGLLQVPISNHQQSAPGAADHERTANFNSS